MLPGFCRRTITVQRAPLVVPRGSHERDWPHAVTHHVAGCSVQPAGTSLDVSEPRSNTTIRWTVFAPVDADVVKSDRILIDGTPYSIDGEPQRWSSPTGRLDHMTFSLIDWRG